MGDSSLQSQELGQFVRHGADTPAEIKDEAFRIWIRNGRGWRKTAKETGIVEQTLYLWASRDGWEQRRQDAADAIGPGLEPDTAFNLRMNANRASRILDRIMIAAEEEDVPINPKQTKALLEIIDRGATTAMSTKHQAGIEAKRVEPTEIKAIDLRNLSPDELMLREQQARSRQP